MTDLNNLNAARMGADGKGWTESNLCFCHPRGENTCKSGWQSSSVCHASVKLSLIQETLSHFRMRRILTVYYLAKFWHIVYNTDS